jgi:hypothetical protein
MMDFYHVRAEGIPLVSSITLKYMVPLFFLRRTVLGLCDICLGKVVAFEE